MPEEIAVILVLFIVLVLAPRGVFAGIKSLRESNPPASSSGSALRRSDLQALIDEAAIEATAPLESRIEELERELLLGDGRLSRQVLEEAFDPNEEASSSGHAHQRA